MKYETIDYKGYSIHINYDECALNPYEDFDCLPPLYVKGNGYKQEYNFDLLPALVFDNKEIRENLELFKRILGGYSTLLACLRAYGNYEYYSSVAEQINDILIHDKEYLTDEALAELYRAKGCMVYEFSFSGYSQGDWLECFIFASPSWANKVGANLAEIEESDLKGDAKLYASWAFGDCFYYTIEDKTENIIESCGGFYGTNHKRNGLLEYAENTIDCHIRSIKAQKRKKLVQLIQAHCPLDKRAEILSDYVY